MKLTRHNGRSGKNGTYNPKHNDRRFDIANSEHIDQERAKQNVYWDCYYAQEFGQRLKGFSSRALQIPWQLDDGYDALLPVMQTDITLAYGNQTLIIDAKYYERTLQTNFDVQTLHSGNMYQIFTYVKNKEAELQGTGHKVSGMLLYAKTEEDLVPDNVYQMSGNQISVKTLDLNQEFSEIQNQLNKIVKDHFGISIRQ